MPCNRDRKHRFILSFGKFRVTGNDAVANVLRDCGLEVFEEWALDLIIADLIQSARAGIKRNRANRAIYAKYGIVPVSHLVTHNSDRRA